MTSESLENTRRKDCQDVTGCSPTRKTAYASNSQTSWKSPRTQNIESLLTEMAKPMEILGDLG
jgi:hypothetical protein